MRHAIDQTLRVPVFVAASLVVVGLGIVLYSRLGSAQAADELRKNRLFELRTYTTAEGKLDDLHKRFREHTNRIFKRHGMQLVGYWTPTEEQKSNNTLVYMLAFPNVQARDAAWKAFRADPEWQRVFKESRKNGRIVTKVESQLLTPTDYSPIK